MAWHYICAVLELFAEVSCLIRPRDALACAQRIYYAVAKLKKKYIILSSYYWQKVGRTRRKICKQESFFQIRRLVQNCRWIKFYL
jgi:hypothetical protein